ncbi:hypothetical protein, partial [Xanthomonas citri]
LTPRPLALAVVLRVAEGQLHRNRLLGSMIDCGRSGRIVQSFPKTAAYATYAESIRLTYLQNRF